MQEAGKIGIGSLFGRLQQSRVLAWLAGQIRPGFQHSTQIRFDPERKPPERRNRGNMSFDPF
jgi:hypothetical protein